jgi:hypothetical protein
MAGKNSRSNHTFAPLAGNATFTGTYESAVSVSSIRVSVATDQNGTLYVDQAPDQTNADETQSFSVTAGVPYDTQVDVTRRYFRVRFTNTSASPQDHIRLQCLLGTKAALNAPTDSVLAQDYDATVVRPTDYHYEVALGRRQGATLWNKFGYNADIDIGTETIWAYGGSFARMTAADTLNIVSSSANDDGSPAGTGAQSVIIYGLDANYVAQTEVVTLNGTGAVTTSSTWIGVNRVSVYLAGSLGYNDGNITVTRTTGGSVQAYMPLQEGTTQQCFFFVQDNHQALMDWLYITLVKNAGGTQPKVTIKCFVTSLVSGARYEVFRDYLNGSVENRTELTPSQPFVVGERSLIEFNATHDVDNTEISCRF